MLNESFQIFRRNPLASSIAVFLIIAASVGQVASLGSLYPILQLLTGTDESIPAVRAGAFGPVLTYVGADVTLANLLVLNRPAEPATREPFFRRIWLNRAFLALQLAFGGYVLATYGMDSYQRGQRIAQESLKVPPIELGGNRRFEEFVAYIGARHVRTPLAVIPKQRFR